MHVIRDKKELSVAVDILAESYANAPNIAWIFPQSPGNLRFFFRVLVEEAAAKDGVYLTDNNAGVLVMYGQKSKHFSIVNSLRKIVLAAFVIGPKNSFRISRLNRIKQKYTPQSGLYGAMLAIKKDEHYWHTIHDLKQGFDQRFKQTHQPIYAETTNARILKLYQQLGFTMFHQMQHPFADLPIYFVKKEQG